MEKKHRIIVEGSREFWDYDLLRDEMRRYIKENGMKEEDIEIVSGTARGADRLGEMFAEESGLEVVLFPADWKKNGNSAGHIRNNEMKKYATDCVAFWDGESKGTKGMIDSATKAGLGVKVVNYKKK